MNLNRTRGLKGLDWPNLGFPENYLPVLVFEEHDETAHLYREFLSDLLGEGDSKVGLDSTASESLGHVSVFLPLDALLPDNSIW